MSDKKISVSNRTARVLRYERLHQALASLRSSENPKDKATYRRTREAIERAVAESKLSAEVERILTAKAEGRAIGPSDVHASGFLGNFSLQYANEDYIGDDLLPVVGADHLTDQYPIWSRRARLAVPDDSMAGRSSANEVFDSRSTDSFTCEPKGLKSHVERKVISNQDAVFDEMMDLNARVAELRALAREKRQMTILTTSANYGSNTAAIGAGDRWDTQGGGDPVQMIRTAKESVLRSNVPSELIGFCPISVYITLATNPVVLDAVKYTAGGYPPKRVLADFFELDDILVAKAWEDTANEGQSASIARIVTSKCFGIIRRAKVPAKRSLSFGHTWLFQNKVNNLSWFEEKEGTQGTYWNQQTTDEIAKVSAADAGWLYTTVTG